MGPAPQTSFVPRQQPGNPVVNVPRRQRRRFNILSFLAIVIFFGSLILSVGVYVLKQANLDTLAAKQKELSDKRAQFKRDDIENVQLLDARIRTASHLLSTHVSPSKLLAVLERGTQEEVQYTSFSFERRPSGNISVLMDGVAPRFNTVARQAQRFADERFFRQAIFANLNKPNQSHVTFNVAVDIARDSIAYESDVLDDDTASTTDATSDAVPTPTTPTSSTGSTDVINDSI